LDELGTDAYGALLAEHHRVCREAWAAHGGVEIDTAGDAFFVTFMQPSDALAAATRAQDGLVRLGVPVRMGVHTGEVVVGDTGYVGMEVHRAARIAAAGHGGQVLMSRETWELVEVDATDLGEHRLKDFREPVWIFQLGSEPFPPLKTISNTNLPRPASSFVGREREVSELGTDERPPATSQAGVHYPESIPRRKLYVHRRPGSQPHLRDGGGADPDRPAGRCYAAGPDTPSEGYSAPFHVGNCGRSRHGFRSGSYADVADIRLGQRVL
jgi:Adenylate and Guanylate cyclase catalytic domain